MIRLSFSERALLDLEEIHDYIADDNVTAALNFINRLKSRCSELTSFPGIGRKREEIKTGYRSICEGEYVIFYRLKIADEIEIVRVVHGKRDLSNAGLLESE